MNIAMAVESQMHQLLRDDREPRHIVFSSEGFTEAKAQDAANRTNCDLLAMTYMGLPYVVDVMAVQHVSVSADPPAPKSTAPTPPVRFRIDHRDPTQTFAEIAGQALTEAQLCDIVMAHCQPRIDADTQTPLQRALHSAVVNFGRFE